MSSGGYHKISFRPKTSSDIAVYALDYIQGECRIVFLGHDPDITHPVGLALGDLHAEHNV